MYSIRPYTLLSYPYSDAQFYCVISYSYNTARATASERATRISAVGRLMAQLPVAPACSRLLVYALQYDYSRFASPTSPELESQEAPKPKSEHLQRAPRSALSQTDFDAVFGRLVPQWFSRTFSHS